ncbi:hypothetical protein [Sphingomonas sp. KR3-1]|uniref:hypothetical protein n=1 Tax=Sphingomonas sp. KR3-1 TaxID=3156611 RepID=UPI0032B33FB3
MIAAAHRAQRRRRWRWLRRRLFPGRRIARRWQRLRRYLARFRWRWRKAPLAPVAAISTRLDPPVQLPDTSPSNRDKFLAPLLGTRPRTLEARVPFEREPPPPPAIALGAKARARFQALLDSPHDRPDWPQPPAGDALRPLVEDMLDTVDHVLDRIAGEIAASIPPQIQARPLVAALGRSRALEFAQLIAPLLGTSVMRASIGQADAVLLDAARTRGWLRFG